MNSKKKLRIERLEKRLANSKHEPLQVWNRRTQTWEKKK